MSDHSPTPGDADVGGSGGEPEVADADEFAKMQAVMRASEKHREGGIDPELQVADGGVHSGVSASCAGVELLLACRHVVFGAWHGSSALVRYGNYMDVLFPALPDKHGYPSAYWPAALLDALHAGGWEPGPVPESVVFTYARFELYLAAHPEISTPNHMLGTGLGRFFLVNATGGRVGVNCLRIGAPAAVA